MRTFRCLGFAALALPLAFTLDGSAQAETIKIGVMLPFSGANADLGHQVDKAFDLYIKLHAKDIAPHKVEIIKRDEGSPTGASAKAVGTELMVNDKVQILTGLMFSPSAIVLAPVVTQAKVPMVIANAGTAWITNLSPYIVRLSHSMWHPAYPMGPFAFKSGCKTSAVAYTDFPPGKDSVEAFQMGFEKAGGKVTLSVPLGSPVQVPDFTPYFQRIKDAHPDCMYVFVPGGAHASGMMKAYGELGMRKAGVKLIGTADIIPDNKLQDMGDAAIGTIVMGHYSADLVNAQNTAFLKAWFETYGKDADPPDSQSAAGWDSMHAIFDTIKKLNGDVSDGAKVIEAMKGWSGVGPRGSVSIDPETRDIVEDEHAFEVIRKPDGRLGVKVLATTKQVKDECKVLKIGRCGS
ncbi:MAG: ABC transporter substrate-binding protein [Pseudolabrys sp.]|nr:ABC transporter substrate-binding protein [Pseudolabrys sp.]